MALLIGGGGNNKQTNTGRICHNMVSVALSDKFVRIYSLQWILKPHLCQKSLITVPLISDVKLLLLLLLLLL